VSGGIRGCSWCIGVGNDSGSAEKWTSVSPWSKAAAAAGATEAALRARSTPSPPPPPPSPKITTAAVATQVDEHAAASSFDHEADLDAAKLRVVLLVQTLVGRCRSTASKPVLKAPMVPRLNPDYD